MWFILYMTDSILFVFVVVGVVVVLVVVVVVVEERDMFVHEYVHVFVHVYVHVFVCLNDRQTNRIPPHAANQYAHENLHAFGHPLFKNIRGKRTSISASFTNGRALKPSSSSGAMCSWTPKEANFAELVVPPVDKDEVLIAGSEICSGLLVSVVDSNPATFKPRVQTNTTHTSRHMTHGRVMAHLIVPRSVCGHNTS
jgi:hypothetical protein